MKIIAELKAPYTAEEKLDFIVNYNHAKNYTIEFSETGLLALAYEDEELVRFREEQFRKAFFEIPAIGAAFNGGWYRKQPKGYSSATESINTAFNIVTTMGVLPKDSLVFYTKPDFTKEEQCTEEWLIANQFKNDAMSKEDFVQLYYAFVTAWNTQEHLEEK